jgi:hypothetical protein
VYKIYINSREFHRRVVAYVPMGRKSNVLPPPPLEGEEALMYIAGFTDGDGWVEHVIKKRGEKRYCYLSRERQKAKNSETGCTTPCLNSA